MNKLLLALAIFGVLIVCGFVVYLVSNPYALTTIGPNQEQFEKHEAKIIFNTPFEGEFVAVGDTVDDAQESLTGYISEYNFEKYSISNLEEIILNGKKAFKGTFQIHEAKEQEEYIYQIPDIPLFYEDVNIVVLFPKEYVIKSMECSECSEIIENNRQGIQLHASSGSSRTITRVIYYKK